MKSSQYLLAGALLVATSSGPAAGPADAATDPGRRVDLGRPAGGTTNVTTTDGVRLASEGNRAAESVRTGLAVYPLAPAEPANVFSTEVEATVPDGAELAIDVRGRDGERWSEWTEVRPDAPAVLPAATRDVQVRAMLSAPDGVASPQLRALTVTPSTRAAAPTAAAAGAGPTYRVFATREGLVGATTANGHRITRRDHFAALPSRRGLAGNWHGDYSVRVCAPNGRCEWAPIWDVGPWNTRDDYWNPPRVRQNWKNLPRGRPEAQAAYLHGYHGGKDQFGRKVANPAGIDLADGMFWDGLRLTTNGWVSVTYQWTGSAPAGHVEIDGRRPLHVRRAPTTRAPVVGMAANDAQVRIECRTRGQRIAGTQGTTNVWYRLATDKFVAAAYVSGGGGAGRC